MRVFTFVAIFDAFITRYVNPPRQIFAPIIGERVKIRKLHKATRQSLRVWWIIPHSIANPSTPAPPDRASRAIGLADGLTQTRIKMDAKSVFISAFIFGYVAELTLRWIWRRWFGSTRHQAGKKAHGK